MQDIKNKIYKAIVLASFTALFVGCNDDFMDRYPSTSISQDVFFNSINDLKTYTDGFHNYLTSPIADIGSDNLAHHNSGSLIDEMMGGGISAQNAEVWSWSRLRNINFFLENYTKVKDGSEADRNHYVGIAKFFRARFYIDKVNTYNDVPWYSGTMGTADTELLHKKQDSRAMVVDSIMADLEYAVTHIKAEGHKSRVTKWAALAQLAEFALQEGTHRKYHSYLGLEDSHKKFLERAVSASEQIMNEGGFQISKSGGVNRAYRELFISQNLQANPETILFIDYDKELNVRRNIHTVLDYEWALSQSLMENYLMKDGTRFTDLPNYKVKDIHEMFVNRDPRFEQTFMKPGFQSANAATPHRLKATLGGYNQIKFYPEIADMISWEAGYTDAFVFRYAEVLLIFAEAKAELGALNSQSDLDRSINLIRSRVDMPAMNLTAIKGNVDPLLHAYYDNVQGGDIATILEIRRERRVELAGEGFRNRDIMRWGLGKRLVDLQQGMYVKQFGPIDVTGDGKVDIAILNSSKETEPISHLSETEIKALAIYYLKDENGKNNSIYLENGHSGHIMFTAKRDKNYQFLVPQYYYYPVANSELVKVGTNLIQTIGWK